MDEQQELSGAEQSLQPILQMGSTLIQTQRGTIQIMTIVGQIEGHQLLPSNSKSTKYEHIIPLLVSIEESS